MPGGRLYCWYGESCLPDSPPIGGASGVADWDECVSLLRSHLHGMAIMYPQTRELILDVQRSLNSADPSHDTWSRSFRVLDLPYEARVTIGIRKEIPVKTPAIEPGPEPRLRAGNDERRRYQEHLTTMFAEGRIDSGQFERRYEGAAAAVYEDELPPFLIELPPLPPEEPEEPEGSALDVITSERSSALARERARREQTAASLILVGGAGVFTAVGLSLPSDADRIGQAVSLIVLFIALVVGMAALHRK